MRNNSGPASRQGGQVMLVTVLVLSGTVLAATTIAGLLMLYQIRQTTNTSDSAKAIFASDAGIEWTIYNVVKRTSLPKPEFTNGASLETLITSAAGEPLVVKSTGMAGRVARALEINFEAYAP